MQVEVLPARRASARSRMIIVGSGGAKRQQLERNPGERIKRDGSPS